MKHRPQGASEITALCVHSFSPPIASYAGEVAVVRLLSKKRSISFSEMLLFLISM